ncbi:helical backbone metal receptor [Ornithinimicrobium cavernae]|uniref:helical backbone metal receptor n=1 Tax=Ornithinimicrobium cavernae TaxID=2666047 RepID=UPI000D688DE6|nr:helical backbone metal receptor [Ornithinimicrobium cavernae]
MPRTLTDDLGHPVELPDGPVGRVVSLVPSLTEAIAATRREALVGATDWCTHPSDLDVMRVRGTKNPDRAAIAALEPELVVVVQEENRELDVQRLREAGVPVWVSVIESVPQALTAMRQLVTEVLGWDSPGWLEQAEAAWGAPDLPPARASVAVPIWRDPWMVVGGRNFTTDLLARAGLRNVYADHDQRYPHVEVADVDTVGADVVLLPDEPYEFGAADGPEAFSRTPTRLVSGRLLTWYGPSLLEAREHLAAIHDDR